MLAAQTEALPIRGAVRVWQSRELAPAQALTKFLQCPIGKSRRRDDIFRRTGVSLVTIAILPRMGGGPNRSE
jgi:hypothetical protein